MTDTALRGPDLWPPRPDLLAQAPGTGLSLGVLTGIVVAVVVVVLLVVLVVGLVLARRRRISLREEAEEAGRAKPAKGSYAAGSGFSFSAGGAGAATTERPSEPEP